MFQALSCLVILFAITSVLGADKCKVESSGYAAGDGTVLTDAAYVLSFTADCPSNVVPLYANVNGRTVLVVKGESPKSFQISWTQDIAKASSGSYDVSFFDEEGYQQFKKSQRSGYSDASKALFTLPYNHSSPYRGPLVQGEVFVLAITFILTYYALVLRFKIVAKKI